MPIVKWYWEFGDGFVSIEQNPQHLYRMPGQYTARLTVEDDLGRTDSVTDTITVYDWDDATGPIQGKTNRCFRVGFNRRQGFGFSEVSGTGWPFPEAGTGIIKMFDTDGYLRLLVLDAKSGKLYNVVTIDGPDGSGQTKLWQDAGTDYDSEVEFGEVVAPQDLDLTMEADKNHMFTRPISDSKRGVAGYDSNGYPTGLKFNLKGYADGQQ